MAKFTPRLVWNIPQADKAKDQQSSQSPDLAPGSKLDLGSVLNPGRNLDLVKQRTDLKDFYAELRLQKALDINGETEKKLHEWDLKKNIEALRTAGVSESENQQNNRKRHVLLSGTFLDETGDGEFTVNFRQNSQAEWKVGLGDMLPPSVLAVSIERGIGQGGVKSPNIDRAVRAQNPSTHRIGYFLESALKEQPPRYEYAFVHTGDKVRIIETRSGGKDLDDEVKKEHDQIYKFGAAKDGIFEPHEIAPSVNPESPGAVPIHAQTAADLSQVRSDLGTKGTALESQDVLAIRNRIVEAANRYAKSSQDGNNLFRNDFKNIAALQGGNVGCARVASEILKDVGCLQGNIDYVDGVYNALTSKGWQKKKDPNVQDAEIGDVVIWGPGPTGHKHIGIVVSKGPPAMCVDNNSNSVDPGARGSQVRGADGRIHTISNGPEVRAIERNRKIEYFLSPPGSVALATSESRLTTTVNTPPQIFNPKQPDIGQRSTAGAPLAPNGTVESSKIKVDISFDQVEKYAGYIRAASAKWGVDEYLIRGVIDQESGGRTDIANKLDCGGLMALLGATARKYGLKTFPPIPNGTFYKLAPGDERADPAKCIDAGTHMLKDLLAQNGGNIQAALASYNWGPTNYQRWVKNGSDPNRMPDETRKYITRIPAKMALYQSRNNGNNGNSAVA